MGQQLSSVGTRADTISAGDRFAEMILGIVWLGALYGIGMIWGAVTLLGRWAGPHGERGFNIFSILAAFILSSAWPLILVYTIMQGR